MLALIAVAAIILMIALLRSCQQNPGNPAKPSSESEMPLDDSPLLPGEDSEIVEETDGPTFRIDPDSGMELEEDELPIATD
ncbi:MAG: hypothetical protein IKH34_10390 [Oscillospiraceae bacterium]|nr:hypothetical protein [Oscillospiraceae bacterium]